MIDLFKNYELQREELFARIAQSLQLDVTRRQRMESAYNAISLLLNDDDDFFKGIEIDVYPQGSVAIGTTCKPLNKNEFDLDIVVHIRSMYTKHTPEEIYNALYRKLANDGRYKDKLERKRRCVRINYSGDFHMDILPGCIIFVYDDKSIKVPDRELKTWVTSGPKGFAEWFLTRANSVKEPMLENYYKELKLRASTEELPNDSYYTKKPLQRAVQLIKRYRDIYFERNPDYATSSVVLTTLMGNFYNGEGSIYSTIDNIVNKITSMFTESVRLGRRFQVFNPVNSQEEFTDSWTAQHYKCFFEFIADFQSRWVKLKLGFETSNKEYIALFGEGMYKQALQDQVRVMSKFSQDKTAIANGLIISGNARTDSRGQINVNSGQRNENHRNFGE